MKVTRPHYNECNIIFESDREQEILYPILNAFWKDSIEDLYLKNLHLPEENVGKDGEVHPIDYNYDYIASRLKETENKVEVGSTGEKE